MFCLEFFRQSCCSPFLKLLKDAQRIYVLMHLFLVILAVSRAKILLELCCVQELFKHKCSPLHALILLLLNLRLFKIWYLFILVTVRNKVLLNLLQIFSSILLYFSTIFICLKDDSFLLYRWYSFLVPCLNADGRGYPPNAKVKVCPTCRGTGTVSFLTIYFDGD